MSHEPVHRLVTFLGTGDYQQTTYKLNDGPHAQRTRYVCRALAELLHPKEITVLATREAENQHRNGLESALRDGNFPSPSFLPIPIGRNPGERWEQFGLLKDQLRNCSGPVMLDVTHGFRSQPLFAASIVAFVRAVDEAPPRLRLSYAAFEAREHDSTPIWEITEFVTLLDWAQALRMFLATGRATQAAAETMRLGSELAKSWAQSGQQGPRPSLDYLGKAMEAFSLDLETLRTGDLLIRRGSKKSSAARLCEAAEHAKADVITHEPPLADVLDRVIDMAAPLAGERNDLFGDGGRKAVAALSELYLDLGRYLEATATVREGWVNFYASETALAPGESSFDMRERKCAEDRANELDSTFREVTDRRNDFLHAQYRAGAQDAQGVIGTVRGLVEKLKIASPRPRHRYIASSASCLVNLSNHPSDTWAADQTQVALALAERIEDVSFPAVPPESDEAAICILAAGCISKIPPTATHALVQGEFTLTFELVRRLQARGVVCLAATSERVVEESGDGRRTSDFRFVRFREYPWLTS